MIPDTKDRDERLLLSILIWIEMNDDFYLKIDPISNKAFEFPAIPDNCAAAASGACTTCDDGYWIDGNGCSKYP